MVLEQESEAGSLGSRRGLLDLAALVGVQTLGAAAVVIAVGNDQGWWVRGCSGPAAAAWGGRRLDGVDTLTRGVLLEVTVERLPDVVVLASADEKRRTGDERDALHEAWVGKPLDGWSVLVVVEGTRRTSRSVLVACLRELLSAAEDALSAEVDGNRQRLRTGLQEREDERKRWARELHDETLQQLGALRVLLTSARRTAKQHPGGGPDPLGESVDLATRLLSSQITSLRHLITELRPAALDELGLTAPLQALAERTEAVSGVKVEVQVSLPYADGELTTRLLPDIEVAVYRVVQEALTNVGRHSDASRARVSVVESDGQVCVEISDDGTGLCHEHGSGFGIRGMRERAALAGGHLEVRPARHGRLGHDGATTTGTLIRLVVPATHRSADSG